MVRGGSGEIAARRGMDCTWAPREEVNCEHMQALLTNNPQRSSGPLSSRAAQVQQSLDVKTALDVTKPSVESNILNPHGDARDAFGRKGWRLQCCGEERPNTSCGEPPGVGDLPLEETKTSSTYSEV